MSTDMSDWLPDFGPLKMFGRWEIALNVLPFMALPLLRSGSGVALVAERLRRLVAQAAVGPHRVVLAPPPVRLRLCIRRRLELPAVEELVPQPAVERLDEPVLPRTGRRHRDRFGSPLRSPTTQRLADRL